MDGPCPFLDDFEMPEGVDALTKEAVLHRLGECHLVDNDSEGRNSNDPPVLPVCPEFRGVFSKSLAEYQYSLLFLEDGLKKLEGQADIIRDRWLSEDGDVRVINKQNDLTAMKKIAAQFRELEASSQQKGAPQVAQIPAAALKSVRDKMLELQATEGCIQLEARQTQTDVRELQAGRNQMATELRNLQADTQRLTTKEEADALHERLDAISEKVAQLAEVVANEIYRSGTESSS